MAGLREMSLRPFVRVPLLFLCALPPSRPLSTRREELTTDRGRPLYDNHASSYEDYVEEERPGCRWWRVDGHIRRPKFTFATLLLENEIIRGRIIACVLVWRPI